MKSTKFFAAILIGATIFAACESKQGGDPAKTKANKLNNIVNPKP
jgi:outer membrane murein-binding lipoprotein Lpp